MIEKTVFLGKVLLFLLLQTQTTNGLFVSIGVYPNHTKYGINLSECGLRYMPRSITRQPKCILNNPGKINETLFPTIKVDKVSNRIFKGRDATIGESPWTVRMKISFLGEDRRDKVIKQDTCSGSLITFEWVLTAAHPFHKDRLIGVEVIGGSKNWVNFVNMSQIFLHPDYNINDAFDNRNDLALVRLDRKYEGRHLKDNCFYKLNTICLPNEAPLNQNEEFGAFSGWGIIDANGTLPERLQIYEAEIMNSSLCDPGFLCANETGIKPGSCVGDSGGPLFQFSEESIPRAIEVGVLQGGAGFCDESEKESTWTPPMSYINWILGTIANNTVVSD